MGLLDGKVAVVTGAGHGIGRGEALELARQGAKVVVNDVGGSVHGEGVDKRPAEEVADIIRGRGGEAAANYDDVADWAGAANLVRQAVDEFGRLDVLVNNAGIVRDAMLFSMSEDDFDAVVRVHLKGTFATTHHAAVYWREESKAGRQPRAAIVNTVSSAGLQGNVGQANYGAAKAGIAAFTVIAAQELARYGVRVNAIAPAARTRMTEQTPGLGDIVKAPNDPGTFDVWNPANVSPLVAYLATEGCPLTGRVLFVQGGQVRVFQPWTMTATLEKDDRWTVDQLAKELPALFD
jgi:NAD(P)-dependent dehydrogenase (short-subunit alcohol dehydrogenase family)